VEAGYESSSDLNTIGVGGGKRGKGGGVQDVGRRTVIQSVQGQ